jgi:mono/diheme cytochrome c family protein
MMRMAMVAMLIAIGLIIFWVRLAAAQGSEPVVTVVSETPPAAAHQPGPGMVPTPTVDRLAAPPTVVNPSLADEGAQLFWLHCQPCHGDQGQGLTDEWRAQYPEEDQNCWLSGCHGDRPYENGFTLPTYVPAVIGGQSLDRFATVGQLYNYVRAAMPFQDPGYLSEDVYLAITAFLARAHGVELDRPLTNENIHPLNLNPGAALPTGTASAAPPAEQNAVEPAPEQTASRDSDPIRFGPWLGIIGVLLALGGIWLWRRSKL